MSHTFHPVSWSINVSIYEVNLRQYTQEGSFDAFRPHLKRLAEMGIDVLWFMPITPISHKNRKGSLGSYYASSSYRTINPEFGSLEEWKTIVSEAHAMGMKVIMDWVANHTGCDHEWTQSHPDFYKRDHNGQFYDSHGWDDVIDLNYENPEMRQEMISCMQQWLVETDIDGFRCDMAMLTPVDFWEQARTALEKSKPLFWLAELDPLDHPEYMRVFDAAYTWRWMNEASRFMNEGSHHVHALRQVLDLYMHSLPSTACPAWFTSNHDENSWNGTEFEKYGDLAYPLAVFSCTWDGIPLIYSGQELPNTKRLAFFDKDQIDWKERPQLHDFFKKLLTLHRTHPALLAASDNVHTQLIHTEHPDKILCFARKNLDREVLVMLNFSGWPLSVQIYDIINLDGYYSLFPVDIRKEKYPYTVELPAYGYAVWVK